MIIQIKTFRQENTAGYSDAELDALNTEWEARAAAAEGLEEFSPEYIEAEKAFADEVARRKGGKP